MTEYKPRKIDLNAESPMNILEKNAQIRAAAQGSREEVEARGEGLAAVPQVPAQGGLDINGPMDPVFAEILQQQQRIQGKPSQMQQPQRRATERSSDPMRMARDQGMLKTSDDLRNILAKIKQITFNYDELMLPSRGLFYDDTNGPSSGIVHLRPMTGAEEEILATPRWAKGGKAVDMILKKCIEEPIDPAKLLTVDRNFLLIFLRGSSYGTDYEVEIKCPNCDTRYATVINLNLEVQLCPETLTEDSLEGDLPSTGLHFTYKLSTGLDDEAINKYRDQKIKFFGEANDDSIHERLAQLLKSVDNITEHREIKTLLKQLPSLDLNHLRNTIIDPPFGVNTKVPCICPSCLEEYEQELPLESNFFFPRRQKERTE